MEFKVKNITCSGCAATIERALKNLEDVDSVIVDVAEGIVTVTGDVDKDEVVEVLDTLGYPEVQ